VEATIDNIRLKNYKVVRPFLFVFKSEPQDISKRFMDFVLSETGQKLLVHEGLVSVFPCPRRRMKEKLKGMSKEKILERGFLLIALSSISILALIAFFIFVEGVPLIWKIGLRTFLLGSAGFQAKAPSGFSP